MRGKKKKLIEELEMELEQLIANSGQSEVDIHSNYNAYYALKKRIDNRQFFCCGGKVLLRPEEKF